MKPRIRGLYVITDKKLIPRDRFFETVEKALRGGADVLQLREKDTPIAEQISLARRLRDLTREYGIPFIVNDFPEVALRSGADGVHIGRGDVSLEEARRILGRHAVIGVSCYGGVEEALDLERRGADYVAFGAVFPTPTKEDAPLMGSLDILREAREKLKIPVVAIGGINKENVEEVLKAGVDAVAVVSAVFGADDPERAARELKSIISRYTGGAR